MTSSDMRRSSSRQALAEEAQVLAALVAAFQIFLSKCFQNFLAASLVVVRLAMGQICGMTWTLIWTKHSLDVPRT